MTKHHKIFFALCLTMFAGIVLRMIFLAGPSGEKYRQEAENISRKNGQIAAIRGRIFDNSGNLLAWSERCYDLAYCGKNTDKTRQRILQTALLREMNINLPESFFIRQHTCIVKFNLTAHELMIADRLSSLFKEFSVDLRWERRHSQTIPELGEVRQIDGMESGISGCEKTHDQILRGIPGEFSVMLDRHGNWINSTFKLHTPPRPGDDVYWSGEDVQHEK